MSEVGEIFEAALSERSAPMAGPGMRLVSLLEERIASLVERHREARKRVEELEEALAARDERIAELVRESGQQAELRVDVRQRIAALIEQVAELEQQTEGASE